HNSDRPIRWQEKSKEAWLAKAFAKEIVPEAELRRRNGFDMSVHRRGVTRGVRRNELPRTRPAEWSCPKAGDPALCGVVQQDFWEVESWRTRTKLALVFREA